MTGRVYTHCHCNLPTGFWTSADSTTGTTEESYCDPEPCSLQWVRGQQWSFGTVFCSYVPNNRDISYRKANNLFEKNAAPILHLAGVEITVVKVCDPNPPAPVWEITLLCYFTLRWQYVLQTDYEGQAKKLMELMEQTDMLIVAGGDGTLQEVITGLLRRPDQVGATESPLSDLLQNTGNITSCCLMLALHWCVFCYDRIKWVKYQ